MAEQAQTQPQNTSTRVPGVAPIKAEYLHVGSSTHVAAAADDDAAEAGTKAPATSSTPAGDSIVSAAAPTAEAAEGSASEPPSKRLKGAARKAAAREQAAAMSASGDVAAGQFKSGHGQNKGRKFKRMVDQGARGICHAVARGSVCDRGAQCKFSHDLVGYLIEKPLDLHFPLPPADPASVDGTLRGLSDAARSAYLDANYSGTAPYVKWVQPQDSAEAVTNAANSDAEEQPQPVSKDYRHSLAATYCVCYTAMAARGGGPGNGCPAGWKCRYLGAHVVRDDALPAQDGSLGGPAGLRLLRPREGEEPDASEKPKMALDETNYVSTDAMRQLGKKKYPLPLTKAIIEALEAETRSRPEGELASGPLLIDREAARADWAAQEANAVASAKKQQAIQSKKIDFEELENAGVTATAPVASTDVEMRAQDPIKSNEGALDYARIRPPEKRRLDWKHGELYLAPLTTVGNLPFRRICSSLGSDIHCGEMGLADGFLHGTMAEWSLVRKWEGERIFGTQIAGNKPQMLVPVAEALATEIGDGLDFVDINCGCPIDLVFNRGAGSALMDATGRLSKILRGVSAALGEVPVTIKLRTGTGAKRTAHKLFSRLQTEWGVGAATLHGRSRKQRYKSLADWSYIRECTDSLRSSVREWNESSRTADQDEMQTIPIYGNGDVYDWRDYDHNLEQSGVDGTMIARGALIKPWLFTEIKEKRDWDISSRERLDFIRQFASFGLSHWGSDTQGVNVTRRYLCEWLSFTCRYVPVGILSELPAKLNDRPPPFHGRDDLETLLASGDSRDWVALTEMFLGRAPDDWNFTPKHKSNSFTTDGGEEQQG